jgi:hypothetical protein
MKIKKYLLILFLVLVCSCEKKSIDTSSFKEIDVDFSSSIMFKDKERYYMFPWKIKLPVYSNGDFLIPKKCDDFKKIISSIFPENYKIKLRKAVKMYIDEGNSLDISSLEGINEFYDFLEIFFRTETGEFRDGYYLSQATGLIMEKWNVKYDSKENLLCPRDNPGFQLLINMSDYLILQQLLYLK